jgi:hypothetical protein
MPKTEQPMAVWPPLPVPTTSSTPQQRRNFTSNVETTNYKLETDPNLRRQEIFNLVAEIESGDPKIQKDSICKLRKYLSVESNPPIQDAIDCEAPRKLISLLQVTTDPSLQVTFHRKF